SAGGQDSTKSRIVLRAAFPPLRSRGPKPLFRRVSTALKDDAPLLRTRPERRERDGLAARAAQRRPRRRVVKRVGLADPLEEPLAAFAVSRVDLADGRIQHLDRDVILEG